MTFRNSHRSRLILLLFLSWIIPRPIIPTQGQTSLHCSYHGKSNKTPKKSLDQKSPPPQKKSHVQSALNQESWDCFEYPKNPYLNWDAYKKILAKFSFPKKSRNWKFQTPKNPSIIPVTWNPEYPPGGSGGLRNPLPPTLTVTHCHPLSPTVTHTHCHPLSPTLTHPHSLSPTLRNPLGAQEPTAQSCYAPLLGLPDSTRMGILNYDVDTANPPQSSSDATLCPLGELTFDSVKIAYPHLFKTCWTGWTFLINCKPWSQTHSSCPPLLCQSQTSNYQGGIRQIPWHRPTSTSEWTHTIISNMVVHERPGSATKPAKVRIC